jgi:uncharacterized protein YndB with AHSA1/START domain
MAIKFEVSTVIRATPEEVYKAWLDSKQHGLMTGTKAKVNALKSAENSKLGTVISRARI